MKKAPHSRRGVYLVASLAVVAVAVSVSAAVQAKELTGKVLAVYHEKVTVNNQALDKVSVTINGCAPTTGLHTVAYAPGALSDDNSLGFLYRDLATAARTLEQKNQYMNSVGGHVTLSVNDTTNQVLKTTFWGYNWECGQNLDKSSAQGSTASPAAPMAQTTTPAAAPPATATPKVGLPGFGRKFGL